MQFEHFGINVPDAAAMADWYVKNCDMKIVHALPQSNQTYFLADVKGRVVMEIYTNPKDTIVDHSTKHPLRFHFAFAVKEPDLMKEKLIKAGASVVEELKMDDGSHLIMMRDPWGVPFQLCNRAKPML